MIFICQCIKICRTRKRKLITRFTLIVIITRLNSLYFHQSIDSISHFKSQSTLEVGSQPMGKPNQGGRWDHWLDQYIYSATCRSLKVEDCGEWPLPLILCALYIFIYLFPNPHPPYILWTLCSFIIMVTLSR